MERLNEILHELGISKVKLAKFLGVSRQMIYNYLELDDLNKWPKDKKVLLLNLLGIKTKLTGTGYVTAQSIAAGTAITQGMEIELTLNPKFDAGQ